MFFDRRVSDFGAPADRRSLPTGQRRRTMGSSGRVCGSNLQPLVICQTTHPSRFSKNEEEEGRGGNSPPGHLAVQSNRVFRPSLRAIKSAFEEGGGGIKWSHKEEEDRGEKEARRRETEATAEAEAEATTFHGPEQSAVSSCYCPGGVFKVRDSKNKKNFEADSLLNTRLSTVLKVCSCSLHSMGEFRSCPRFLLLLPDRGTGGGGGREGDTSLASSLTQ